MELTEHRNLRGGRTCWLADSENTLTSDALPSHCDIVVIGAGIMGAMIADRLAGEGHRVLILDRRPPAHGSTAASTALVMWGADVPLTHLARTIGMTEAASRWRRLYRTVGELADRIDRSGIDCGRIDRPELYLAGTTLDEPALRAEGEARQAAGLPSAYLEADAVAARFGIAPRAALLSAGSYEVDPVRLTLGLLARARGNGVAICFPFDVDRLDQEGDATRLHGDDGQTVIANRIIVASGYERPLWFLPPAFSVGSSYAIATPPGRAPIWRENAMIWEASSPYLYTRATADGRIIAGGEDEDFDDARQRDALIGAKAGTIAGKLAAMIDVPNVEVDCAWSAAFGASPDGLPAIGQVRNRENMWLASGFGGNGVTFAALAAELLASELCDDADPDLKRFDPYRFESASPSGGSDGP